MPPEESCSSETLQIVYFFAVGGEWGMLIFFFNKWLHIEWYQFRKSSRMFFRILIYTRGVLGNGKNRPVLLLQNTHEKCDGLPGAATGELIFP